MERAHLMELARATGCAEERAGRTFLCDPKWSATERAQAAEVFSRLGGDKTGAAPLDGWLGVPTGGSGGKIRFARHDERTLSAAVDGFRAYFGIDQINAVDVLPPHHVSGLMARVRCAASGGRHLPSSWKQIESGSFPALADTTDGWVLSLVPTQLQRLLEAGENARDWLRKFRALFLGGGPVWPELTVQAARAELRVALSYGMTETAAMIAATRPGDFSATTRGCGSILPHARVEIVDEITGARLPAGDSGLVRVSGANLFIGYMPEARTAGWFDTEDIGRLDADGALTILGRRDATIITGGKKVQPGEVEAALKASGAFADVVVIGLPDAEWGQAVVACHPETAEPLDFSRVEASLAGLAGYKRPKRFVALSDWPRNAQGKVNRPALLALLMAR